MNPKGQINSIILKSRKQLEETKEVQEGDGEWLVKDQGMEVMEQRRDSNSKNK